MVQHRRINERGQLRLATHDILSLGPHAIPDRIKRGKLCSLRTDLMHCHVLASRVLNYGRIIARAAESCPARLLSGECASSLKMMVKTLNRQAILVFASFRCAAAF